MGIGLGIGVGDGMVVAAAGGALIRLVLRWRPMREARGSHTVAPSVRSQIALGSAAALVFFLAIVVVSAVSCLLLAVPLFVARVDRGILAACFLGVTSQKCREEWHGSW